MGEKIQRRSNRETKHKMRRRPSNMEKTVRRKLLKNLKSKKIR